MKKLLTAVALAGALLSGFSDVMDKKAAVLKTVATAFSGTAEITCDDTRGWSFDVSAGVDDGRDVVTVRISRADDAEPPKFGVFFRVPGAGVQNVWISDHARDGTHLWPRLWWGWKASCRSELANEMPIAVGFNSAGISPVALACSEARRLHDDRSRVFCEELLGRGEIREGLEGCRRHVVLLHDFLAESLGAFESSGSCRRAESAETASAEFIHHTGDQRNFRANDGKVNLFCNGEVGDGLRVCDIHGDALAEVCHARVTRSANESVAHGRLLYSEGDCIFTAAATDYENIHVFTF